MLSTQFISASALFLAQSFLISHTAEIPFFAASCAASNNAFCSEGHSQRLCTSFAPPAPANLADQSLLPLPMVAAATRNLLAKGPLPDYHFFLLHFQSAAAPTAANPTIQGSVETTPYPWRTVAEFAMPGAADSKPLVSAAVVATSPTEVLVVVGDYFQVGASSVIAETVFNSATTLKTVFIHAAAERREEAEALRRVFSEKKNDVDVNVVFADTNQSEEEQAETEAVVLCALTETGQKEAEQTKDANSKIEDSVEKKTEVVDGKSVTVSEGDRKPRALTDQELTRMADTKRQAKAHQTDEYYYVPLPGGMERGVWVLTVFTIFCVGSFKGSYPSTMM